MGTSKTASLKKKKPINKAHTAHKPVKKTEARPTKTKAKKEPVAKKPAKPSKPEKAAKKPEKSAPAPKPKAEPAPSPAKASLKPASAAPPPATKTDKPSPRLTPDELRKQLKARSRTKTQRAGAFTLDDVRGEIARSTTIRPSTLKTPKTDAGAHKHPAPLGTAAHKPVPKVEQRHFGAASLADILGYNPVKNEKPEDEEAQIDKKFIRFYKLLVELRDHVKSGLETHTGETLKRSSREDSGDLSGYGQHMADAGTDSFDRDFALSLVSNEQEALFEVEEAIKRIKKGTYGTCELTGKPINKDRLLAVPFARFSVESQAEIEKTKRRSSRSGAAFGEAGAEDGARIAEEDSE